MGGQQGFFLSAEALREQQLQQERLRQSAERLLRALRRMQAADLPENAYFYTRQKDRVKKLIRYHEQMGKALQGIAEDAAEMQASVRNGLTEAKDHVVRAESKAGAYLAFLDTWK